MAHQEFRAEPARGDPPRSLIGNSKQELHTVDKRGRLSGRQMGPRVPEHTFRETERVRGMVKRDEPFQSPEGTRPTQSSHINRRGAGQQPTPTHEGSHAHSSRPPNLKYAYYDAPSEPPPGYRRGVPVVGSYPQLAAKDREPRRSDAPKSNTVDPNMTPSSQTAELRRRYEMLLREYESVRSELGAKNRSLEAMDSLIETLAAKNRSLAAKDSLIETLTAKLSALQQGSDEQSAVLRELQSGQSQLDNVHPTADTHASQDHITQKLQELNEEVYKMSMTMADRMAEGFTRQTGERTLVGDDTLVAIGEVLVRYLGTLGKDDDVALYLQLAFQAYLSYLLCHVVSSWTIDRSLNTLIEETYQRLRRAETQAISGRWRNLTRTHILPSYASNPNILVEYAVVGLSDIVVAAGLASSQFEAMTKFGSEFGEKILCVVSHAGKFGSMMSEMISGDFSVFTVQPGAMFDKGSMEDMTEDDNRRSRGTRGSQTVLCAFRVGLKKQTGERAITLTKAQVVLKSFLG